MSVILTVIAVIVIFSILVLIHEYGHFIAARKAGIKVLEFGIGFPPRLFKKKVGETIYSVNAIPFGGFVKLFGEDATDSAVIRNKRSYAHKSPWIRTKVVIAGVFMNFILAIALLTIGFSFGIEPLLVNEQDLFTHLQAGNVETTSGVFVAKVDDRVNAASLPSGTQILAINDVLITDTKQLVIFEKGKAERDLDLTILLPPEAGKKSERKKIHIPLTGDDNYLGIDLKPYLQFPRLMIAEVKPGSASQRAGLLQGDLIIKMNGEEVYFPPDFEATIAEFTSIDFVVLRGTELLTKSVTFPDQRRTMIYDVTPASAAFKAGFRSADIIIAIDGKPVEKAEQVQELLKKNPRKEMTYRISRGGKELTFKATTDEKNILGVALSGIYSFKNSELSVSPGTIPTSITKIHKVRYPPFQAFKQAISESVRLTGLTISAFGRTVSSIFSKGDVPADIGGPVQIAYYTHTFVKEGFFALLRFTALLSLSLAVINVLPIPALDGGRLLFIGIEVLLRRRVNARLEAIIHAIGFILLLGLIALVTYSDIVKLF